MLRLSRLARGASFLGILGVGGLVGCAHVAEAPKDAKAAPERVLVTGSHIPQRVDLRTGLPATAWPLRIYTYNDLRRTGRPDLGAALRVLDPGATITGPSNAAAGNTP